MFQLKYIDLLLTIEVLIYSYAKVVYVNILGLDNMI